MGERKVLNKYYPPDFDPSKIPRRRQPKNQQMKVRMMLPMSIRCNTCGNYIYKGTKFNSRKEDVVGEENHFHPCCHFYYYKTYLGIQIFRFYFKCTKCSAEITYKTDPQNSDYTVEAGATRNFEPWRSTDEAVDEAKKKRDAEEMGDAMKALENRTLDSKREMDIIATLDELISMKARHHALGTEVGLEALRLAADMKEKELAEEDEALLRTVVFHNSAAFVRRLEDDDDGEDCPPSKKARPGFFDTGGSNATQATTALLGGSSSEGLPVATAKRASTFTRPEFIAIPRNNGPVKEQIQLKQAVASADPMLTANEKVDNTSNNEAPTGLASLCAYNDDDDSSSD